MALTTDDSAENTSVPTEVNIEDNKELAVQPESVADQSVPDEGTASEDAAVDDPATPDDTGQVHDRKEEVTELLGGSEVLDSEEPEIVPVQDVVSEDPVLVENSNSGDEAENVAPITESINNLLEDQLIPVTVVESESAKADPSADWTE